ncbi:Putative 2-hydroxyacid dehydrogenase protein (fragment) [uncultured Stenotrophomonas sp.]|uniref:Putative 2-hydroxyacid dehydrogenase protein n=1 Tax=uncultured Stenotrophomonas sp. TaxID=165438 RepID=A0A1Y5Q271_9GAMM
MSPRASPEASMAECRPRVWVSQPLFDDTVAQLAGYCNVVATAEVAAHEPAAIAAHLSGFDGALVTLNERIGAAEIANAPALKVATNTPDVLTETTADLGFALLMATARHIGSASLAMRRAMVQVAVDNLLAGLGIGTDAGRPANMVNAIAGGKIEKR